MTTVPVFVIIVIIFISAGAIFTRLVIGPSVADRIVAANAIGILFFALIILLTEWYEARVFFDVALVYAILQFVDILIIAKYLGRKG